MDAQRYSPSMDIGRRHRSLTNMLRLIVRCPHCGDTLDQPTTLMCGHTVCSKHVATTPGSRNSSALSQPPRFPSCPILTCFTPTGARPLRPRDNDEQSPTVIYHPPPTDDPAYRMPPPPSAQIKIDNPKQDVTLSKVIRVLAPFLDIFPSPLPSHPEIPHSTSSDAAIARGVGTMVIGPDDSPSLPRPLVHGDLESVTSLTYALIRPGSHATSIIVPSAFDAQSTNPSQPSRSRSPSPQRQTIDPVSAFRATRPRSADCDMPSNVEDEMAVSDSEESTKRREELVEALLPEVMCEICYSLFYDPVTTMCQHTFCSTCLLRSLDHSPLCPLCRQDLPGFAFYHEHPSSRVLLDIIKMVLPSQYAARKTSLANDELPADNNLTVPIFPCALAFPGMPISLNIYEPRYRLMLRRCLSSGIYEFGMTMHPRPGEPLVLYGTMLRVTSVRLLSDGRSAVETRGQYRFKILDTGWLDGYTIARIERIDDYPPEVEALIDQAPLHSPPTSSSRASTPSAASSLLSPRNAGASRIRNPFARTTSPLTTAASASPSIPSTLSPMITMMPLPTNEELMATCHTFIDNMRARVAPWVIQRMDQMYGLPPSEPASLSFWIALVLPIDDYDKAKLLPLRSPRLRLRLIVHWIEAMDNHHWWQSSGCVVM